MSFAVPELVIARHVADRYADCLRTDRDARIDVATARVQHAGYVAALRELGVEVEVLAAEEACPDSCFVEDTAVVLGAHALATRPGAPSRRAEVAAVASRLAARRVVHAMNAPATLDGGDVLRAGAHVFVGVSTRTNGEGVDALTRVAELEHLTVVPIDVRGGLHLKSACTLAGPALVVYDEALIDATALSAFRAAGLDAVGTDEAAGANVLAIGGAVLVSTAAPRTAARLAALGLDVRTVDVGELHKGDGALTCLSLRIAGAGAWCT